MASRTRTPHAAPAVAFDAAQRDGILAQDLAALDDAPARRLERGINMFGSGFGFVHTPAPASWPVKAWCNSDFFNDSSAASFCW